MRDGRKRLSLRSWGRRQLFSFFSSLGALLEHRTGTLMTGLVLGIAMALPLGLHVAVNNLAGLDLQQDRWGTVTVFLDVGVDGAGARALADGATAQFGAVVETVSPEQGMEQFQDASGFGQALDMFEESPLPWVLQVTPEPGAEDGLEVAVMEVAGWLESQSGVDFVQVDYKWLKRLESLVGLGAALVTLLTVLLALAVVAVVANTIRLDVANRAEEIQVLNMVGAPDGFIRLPFLYSGFWYGLMGSVVALLLLSLALFYLEAPVERLIDAYGNTFEIQGLGMAGSAVLLFGGGLLGLIGSWLAVGRHLRQFRLEEMRPRK